MKAVFHPVAGGVEEEAMLDPICIDGRMPVAGPLVVMTTAVGAGGVLEGTSSGLIGRGGQEEWVGLYLGFVVAWQDVHQVGTNRQSYSDDLSSRHLLSQLQPLKNRLT